MKVVTKVLVRVVMALLTLLLLSMLIFAAMNYKSPEDIARAAIGRAASPEQLDAYAAQHHLDDPLPTRYVAWLKDFTSGDMGVSPVTNRPVSTTVTPALERSLKLAAAGIILGLPTAL